MNTYVIHTHIYAGCTSAYDNIRLITNIFKLNMAKFVSTLRCILKSLSIKFWPIAYFFILKWVMYIVTLCHTLNECTQMYVNVRLHTTMYNILREDVQQCTTMFDNVRQCTTKNDFLTTVFLSHPKVLHVKLFF